MVGPNIIARRGNQERPPLPARHNSREQGYPGTQSPDGLEMTDRARDGFTREGLIQLPRGSKNPAQSNAMDIDMIDQSEPSEELYTDPEARESDPPPGYKEHANPGASASGEIMNEQPSIHDYQGLQAQFKRTEAELNDLKLQYEETRKEWKRTGAELNRILSSGPTFHSITDGELIRMASGLRYKIRNFAIQHFEGPPKGRGKRRDTYFEKDYFWAATDDTDEYWAYLDSSSRCPSLVQAVLWIILSEKIFRRYVWAGHIRKSIREVHKYLNPEALKPEINENESSSFENERKFWTWVATTSSALLENADFRADEQLQLSVENEKERLAGGIADLLKDHIRSSDIVVIKAEIREIVVESIKFDEEISRQVSRVDWEWPSPRSLFDAQRMELEKGERVPKSRHVIALVIAPALTRRGRSDGEEFQIQRHLLPMEVSCNVPLSAGR